jgi:hypothetical protein
MDRTDHGHFKGGFLHAWTIVALAAAPRRDHLRVTRENDDLQAQPPVLGEPRESGKEMAPPTAK